MKRKLFIVFAVGLMFGILAGCGQVEDILSKVNQLLDGQLEGNEATEEDSGQTENSDAEAQSAQNDEENAVEGNASNEEENTADQTAGEPTSDLPFDERLISQGYDIKTLPDGLPFGVPYHWVLVDGKFEDPTDAEYKFCFDLPLDIQEVANYFDTFDSIQNEYHGEGEEIIHTTTFKLIDRYLVEGIMEYTFDEHNNTCVNVRVLIDEDSEEGYGEDPDTMMSEEELAAEREGMKQGSIITEDRERFLPEDYEEAKRIILEDNESEARNVNINDILSIKEKIRNNEREMYHLYNGFPTIIPYEWYLVQAEDDPGQYPGVFCTDTPLNEAALKHLDMLADHNADIEYVDPEVSTRQYDLTEIVFQFNDEHGTGSWKGYSNFYIQDEGRYPLHRCVNVDMWHLDEPLD